MKHENTKMKAFVLIIVAVFSVCTAFPIFIVEEPTALSKTPYAHPGVLANAAMEDALPSELKNRFYKDPRIVAGLAKESWFGNKEMQVIDREADKIPREKIFDALHNAGLVRR